MLKGSALREDLYDSPLERPQSDIDVLVAGSALPTLGDKLRQKGAFLVNQGSWEGDKHKQVWKWPLGKEAITVEVHSRLYWHHKHFWPLQVWDSSQNLWRLDPTDEILYLMYHCAYQHNFLKLFWLREIFLHLQKYQDQLDSNYFWNQAKLTQLSRSARMCLALIERTSQTPLPMAPHLSLLEDQFVKHVMSPDFLWWGRRKWVRYFWLKHFVKDDFFQGLRYDFLWLRQKCEKSD